MKGTAEVFYKKTSPVEFSRTPARQKCCQIYGYLCRSAHPLKIPETAATASGPSVAREGAKAVDCSMTHERRTRNLTIRFALTKGEGIWPQLQDMTPGERADLRKIGRFFLDVDREILGDDIDIISCEFVYDGISPLFLRGRQVAGLSVREGGIGGRPCPIIRFRLRDAVDAEQFRRGVWGSSYRLSAKKSPEEFYCEDWNGYTSVLHAKEREPWLRLVRNNGIQGREFSCKLLERGLAATTMFKKFCPSSRA